MDNTANHNNDVANPEPPIPIRNQEKKGAKCCGFCCDYRRAVIIVNFIGIIVDTLLMIAFFGSSFVSASQSEEFFFWSASVNGILTAITLLFNIVAIIGALQYNIYLIGTVIGWTLLHYVVHTIIEVVTSRQPYQEAIGDQHAWFGCFGSPTPISEIFLGAIAMVLIIYPHVGFVHEVKSGILSRETYPREEFSCCCGPR